MKSVLLCLLLLLISMTVKAEDTSFYPEARYRENVPTPEQILGYKLGERFTHHHQIVAYYQRLAQVCDNIRIVEYGRTVEQRPLLLLLVSSKENLSRLEEVKLANARLSDPRRLSDAEMESMIKTLPGTVWLSYGVHGDEASSAEAAMQTVYHLLADETEQTARILKSLVVVVDPLVNPDGRERYVSFYEQARGRTVRSDPNAYEHQPPWPAGRYNHYLFDMNRDWSWQTQYETRARVKAYLEWNPQVHVDYHEMTPDGMSYFFPPAAKPINQNIPQMVLDWLAIYGRGNAAMLDRFGILYYTGEDYDLQYPGYGDSWPALNGAVGMTYEKAGGGRAGLAIRFKDRRYDLTLRDRIQHHFLTGVATLQTAVETREARLRDYYRFRKQAIEAGRSGQVKSYILLPGRDPERAARLVSLLMDQGIEVCRAERSFRVKRAHSYYSTAPSEREFEAGSYIVDLAQPAGLLAKSLLEPESPVKDLFFYDVTAWTLPLAYGVESYWTEDLLESPREPLRSKPVVKGQVKGGRANYAYIFSYETNAAAKTLVKLLEEDIEVFTTLRPFKIRGQDFAAGTIVVPLFGNPEVLHQRIAELAAEHGHDVLAVSSGRTESGVDLGSGRLQPLRRPKLLVVMGPGVNVADYGATWFQFDEVFQLSFTPVTIQQLNSMDLAAYNTILLPDGAYDAISKATIEKLGRWLRNGNVLIGVKGGAVFATSKESGLTSVTYRYVSKQKEEERLEREREKAKEGKSVETVKPESEAKSEKPEEVESRLIPYSEREKRQMADSVPGVLMRLRLDSTHPLGFGYNDSVVVLNNSSPILSLTAKGENIVWYPKEGYRVVGFITPENEKKMQNSAYLLREQVGRGSVILYADTPNFRAFWEGTVRLFLNSIFFGHITDPNIE